jgi:hypothetical protein
MLASLLHGHMQGGLHRRGAAVGCHLLMKRMLHHKRNNRVGGCQLWPTGGSVVVDKCN